MNDQELEELQRRLDDAEEKAFLALNDLDHARTENIALKNFIQNLYESCEGIEDMDISLKDVIKNLRENIRVFSRHNNIRL